MKIALLDDKTFGLEQIKNALLTQQLTAGLKEKDEIIYFSSFTEFQKSDEVYDILFLDYYLDNDDITSDTIIDLVRPRAKILIGFSSAKSGNAILLSKGADYAVEKSWSEKNEDLENLFLEIL